MRRPCPLTGWPGIGRHLRHCETNQSRLVYARNRRATTSLPMISMPASLRRHNHIKMSCARPRIAASPFRCSRVKVQFGSFRLETNHSPAATSVSLVSVQCRCTVPPGFISPSRRSVPANHIKNSSIPSAAIALGTLYGSLTALAASKRWTAVSWTTRRRTHAVSLFAPVHVHTSWSVPASTSAENSSLCVSANQSTAAARSVVRSGGLPSAVRAR